MRAFLTDLRSAFRSLRRETGFVLLSAVTLGVGVGSTATVFGMVNQLLLRPVPGVADPDDVAYVELHAAPGEQLSHQPTLNTPDFDELRARADLLSGIAAYGYNGLRRVSTNDGVRVIGAQAESTYGDYFDVLGVKASEGRLLRAEEGLGNPRVAVISERLRQELFGDAGDVAGRTIVVDGQSVTLLGVAGDAFQGARRSLPVDMWLPLSALTLYNGFSPEHLTDPAILLHSEFVARPRSGVHPEQAEAQLRSILEGLARAHPDAGLEKVTATFRPGLRTPPELARFIYAALRVLFVVVGLVLLIACANVATLLLMRNVGRRGSVATRRALGASSGQIARYHLAESALLAVLGAATGLLVAWLVSMSFAGQRLARGMPALASFHLDGRVLLFAVVASVVTLVGFGSIPAVLAGRFNLSEALRMSGGFDTPRMAGLRRLMSAGQIAVCVALATGAALLIRTLDNLYAVDMGIQIRDVATVDLGQPASLGAPSALSDVYRDLVAGVRDVPGVEAAGMDMGGPLTGRTYTDVALAETPDQTQLGFIRPVTPGWFDVVQLPILRGESFHDGDWRPGSTPVPVVLSSALAYRIFGRTEVVGRTLLVRTSPEAMEEARVVGVSGDVTLPDQPDKPLEAFFVPLASFPFKPVTLLVRARSFDPRVRSGIHEAVQRILPSTIPPDPIPLTVQLGDLFTEQRVLGRLLALLSTLAGILASVGLYSVIAFSVAQRRREFGIRVALGAEDRRIAGLVLGDAASIVAVGTGAGLAGAYVLSILLASRLYGVTQLDPLSYAAAATLFALVAAAACWVPVRAALRADPLETLREA